MIAAVSENSLQLVKDLIIEGAKARAMEGARLTAAAAAGHLDMVRLLASIKERADAAFIEAASSCAFEILDFLLEGGASIEHCKLATLARAPAEHQREPAKFFSRHHQAK